MLYPLGRTPLRRIVGSWGVCAIIGSASILSAQNTTAPPGEPPNTAAQDVRGTFRLYPSLGLLTEDREERIPKGRFDAELEDRTRQWVVSLQAAPVTGIQLDAMGRLAVVAGKEDLAKQQFAARLATPGLSLYDQAFTLLAAVEAFGVKASNTTRMQTAMEYLAKLDAMPAAVLPSRFQGHLAMGSSYYREGKAQPVIEHMTKAFSLVPQISYDRRHWLMISNAFILLANVWSGQPDGRAKIDSLGSSLLSYAATPPELANDSAYYWYGQRAVREFKKILQLTGFLGRPAPGIEAHYWLNGASPTKTSTSAPGAQLKALDDGKIRVMEYGSFG